MQEIVKQNPSIKANEMILKIHQKNAKTANFLTSRSKMLDIKSDPIFHGQYLIARLRIENLSKQISDLKKSLNAQVDESKNNETYIEISNLTKEKNELQIKLKEMI